MLLGEVFVVVVVGLLNFYGERIIERFESIGTVLLYVGYIIFTLLVLFSKGGNIPAEYIPAIEKGVIQALESGPLAGYPVVDVKVTVFDGSHHEVDSSEMAFTEAGRQCFRTLFLKSHPQLIEPLMDVEVTVPEEYMGAATSSICQRRGRIEGMVGRGDSKIVHGLVPLSEMFGYSNTIRTLTQGRGTFTMSLARHEVVPAEMAEAIIEKRRKENKIRG